MDAGVIVGIVTGVVGATLGVVNFIIRLRDEKVRLRVIPTLVFVTPHNIAHVTRGSLVKRMMGEFGNPHLAVEIINLSKFPVIINEVGLTKGKHIGDPRSPFPFVNRNLPHTLQSRCAVKVQAPIEWVLAYAFTTKTKAYADTECDTRATAKGEILHELAGWYAARQAQVGLAIEARQAQVPDA